MSKLLGIDPGRSKTGLALVNEQGEILDLYLAQTANLEAQLLEFIRGQQVEAVIMGNGTHSDVVAARVGDLLPNLPLYIVEESYSTEEARALYWQVNPPRGWRKLLPMGLNVPDEPLDAYAAVILVKRYLGAIQA